MIRLILTILMLAALAYGLLWLSKDFGERRDSVMCHVDYGLKGCTE